MLRSILLFLFFAIPAFPFYIGNPAFPGIMNNGIFTARYPFIKLTSGYVGDYVSNKKYVATQTAPDFDPNDVFSEFGLHSQLATFSIILLERMEIFGMVGGSKEHAKWHDQPPESDTTAIFFDFHSAHHFSWSAGTRIILLKWGNTFLGTDFTYFNVPSSPKSFFKFFNRLNLPLDLEKQPFGIDEWQVGGALSTRIWMFTPYAGVDYLKSRLAISSGPATSETIYHNERKFGYFFGLTFSLTGKFHVNVERRVQNEFAYSLSSMAVF